jgi:hypothetical protein
MLKRALPKFGLAKPTTNRLGQKRCVVFQRSNAIKRFIHNFNLAKILCGTLEFPKRY